MCGFGAALGVAAALYQKSRTGVIGRPRTSLSALTGLAQIPFCYDYANRGPFDEPSGRETKGCNALSRLYETASGIIFFYVLRKLICHASAGRRGLRQLSR